jgi:hypothetical protein
MVFRGGVFSDWDDRGEDGLNAGYVYVLPRMLSSCLNRPLLDVVDIAQLLIGWVTIVSPLLIP